MKRDDMLKQKYAEREEDLKLKSEQHLELAKAWVAQ